MQIQLSTWQISSDLPPLPQYVPNSLNLKNCFTWGNPWLGGICRSLGEDRNWWGEVTFLGTQQESVHFTLWARNEVASTDIQFLWAPSPALSVAVRSPSTTLGGTRHHLSERSNPGEDKSLDLFHYCSRLTLRQGSSFNTSCSEVSCWWAEGWGQSVGRKKGN